MATIKEVRVPDIGGFNEVEVIEILVKDGDVIKAEDALLTLESDKATMDIPAPFGGKVKTVRAKIGEKVSEGSMILTMEVEDAPAAGRGEERTPAPPANKTPPVSSQPPAGVRELTPAYAPPRPAPLELDETPSAVKIHASPSVRAFARELGASLALVKGSGPKRRILKEDVQAFIKSELTRPRGAAGGVGLAVLEMPQFDFAKFGAVEVKPLTKIKKLSGANLHRNWVTAPHVTQHDEADITDLEAFRKAMGEEAQKQGVRLTLPAFLAKAVVATLKAYPDFNASLSNDGEALVMKKYFHIGVAVDTPDGLVVPVIRNADQKGVLDIARELGDLSARARDKKISPAEMQGGCISISSLGGIGGSFFTPIINSPEVAVLGVSRAVMKPLWNGKEFVPRLMLPLSLSYDHRVIDGAQGARFVTYLGQMLADVRRLLL
ncbi:MAG: dihydrolipoyllysine-residue acetyltransferase [Sulfuricella sp.]|nr:dihydrolipoyllysine-residue acetyltransferase [Sulfuricella sp.]